MTEISVLYYIWAHNLLSGYRKMKSILGLLSFFILFSIYASYLLFLPIVGYCSGLGLLFNEENTSKTEISLLPMFV